MPQILLASKTSDGFIEEASRSDINGQGIETVSLRTILFTDEELATYKTKQGVDKILMMREKYIDSF